MINVKKIKKNKAVNYIVMVIVAILMISISFTPVLSDDIEPFGNTRFMKVIVGSSAKCSGGPPTTGSLVSITSSLGTVTGATLSDGAFQVSIAGEPPDPGWPDGTTFTVTITDGSWTGTKPGTVSGTITDVGLVTLYPPTLNAVAGGSPTTIVAGETVSFTGSASGGAIPYSWSWDFGGDGSSILQNPTHTFNTQGTYVCVLTVTDACSTTDTDSVTITVNPALSCDANGPYSGTICNAVQFTGTATGGHPGYSWDWDFGDGSPHSSEQNPSHLYASDGSYTATLTVTDSQLDTAVDTAAVSISTSSVAAEAGGPYSGTTCNPISFSGGVTGGCPPYSYSWDFGDGSGTSTLQNPTYQYTGDGSYTATFIVTDDKGGSDTDTASVSISTPGLVASADGPDNGCTGESVSFTGSATGGCTPYSWSWGFGDGGTSSQQNPSHTYSSPGVYTVTLTVTDDASNTDADSFTITIADCLLDVDAHGPYYGDVGESIQFTGSVSGGTAPYYYQWDFGDGSISDEQNPTYAYSEPSPPAGYPITLYVIDSTGTNGQDQTRAHITGDLIADADGPYFGSVGESIQFTGSASGGTTPYSFSWDFGDGSTSTEQNPTHSYTVEGEYTVILTVTDDDKTDSDSTTATIGEDIPVPDLECEGSLSWVDVVQRTTVNGTFIVRNIGDSSSSLNWEVDSYPDDWGEWVFTPSEDSGLTPGDGDISVEVTLIAPKAKSMLLFFRLDDAEEFTGDITVVNKDNPSDSEVIPVSITVSKGKVFSLLDIFEYLMYRFPILEKILKILI